MELKAEIKDVSERLKSLQHKQKKELQLKKENFRPVGRLEVGESDSYYIFPNHFRRCFIELVYTNIEEAADLGIFLSSGGHSYYYLEGYLIAVGEGTLVLDVPQKATEDEWLEITMGYVPRKFFAKWIKDIVSEEKTHDNR